MIPHVGEKVSRGVRQISVVIIFLTLTAGVRRFQANAHYCSKEVVDS